MPLFQEKIIEKALGTNLPPIPEVPLAILQSWKDKIENGSLEKQTEVAIHSPFTQSIVAGVLGYTPYGTEDSWTVAREYGVARGAVDLALGHFGNDKGSDKVLAPFELKGAKTKDLDAIMPGRHKTPVQQAWEYAKDIKGVQWVLVSNYVEIRLYAVSETSLVYEQFSLAELTDPKQYARFILLLHADNLLSGKTAQLLNQSLLADKEITTQLYDDYKTLRETLITHLIADNPDKEAIALIAPAQKLLDRFLFVAFAEDKGLIPDNTILQAFEHADPYNPRPIYENFKGLFLAIDQGNAALQIPAYNGGLFATDEELNQLNVTDEVCHAVNELAKYDFDSEISVTVLGHIFEQSIADLEALTAQVEEGELPTPTQKGRAVSGKRKRQGVVYTPDHITAFIVEHTLGSHINERFLQLLAEYGKFKDDETIQWKKGKQTELKFWYAWQQTLHDIKVVDPACGSGAFLVAAFDYLHAEYRRINDKLAELTGQHSVLDLNKEILTNNLYGVDINPESIEISKLSLWLKTAERGKSLTSLDANIIAGNSLGLFEPAPGESFCWQNAFPAIMAQGGFDVVLGNPPYVRMELLKEIKPWLEQHYQVVSDRADLYAYFFELGHKLLKPGGRMSYISSSTFFKTGSGEPLRRYLAEQTTLERIVEFGDLQVFEGVTTYPAIVVLRNEMPQGNSEIAILVLTDHIPANLSQYFAQQHGTMPHSRISGESWQLEDERLARLRLKLVEGRETIKDIYGAPLRGIVSGLNEAFVISRETRDSLIKNDPKSEQLLKPFLEGKDLKRWHAEPRDLWLIYIPKGKINIDDYPAVREWLLPFKEKLEKRATKQMWFELQQAQQAYVPEFEKEKIFYPDITDSQKFHMDKSSAYSGNTAYFIPSDNAYLIGLLNSTVTWFFLRGVSDSVRGGFYRMFSQNLNRIPIPTVDEEKKDLISKVSGNCQILSEQRYTIENNFRRRLPDLCPPEREAKLNKKLENWWQLDFAELQKQIKSVFKSTIPIAERNEWHDYFEGEKAKIAGLNQQVVQLELELNKEVYQLFDLTPEEISIIETQVS
jgi:type I restriction-modification system DNA methylase subunit